MKLNRFAGISLVALATAPIAACGPKPNPVCDSGVWSPVVNGCVRPCGTRENPTYDDCYDTDAGVFIEAGSDRDARADGAAMDAAMEAGRDVISLPDADAAMEAGPACTAPEVDCGGACVSTESSVAHCGACGRACTTSVANARPVCAMGACDFECAAGFELAGAACEVRVPRAIGPMTSATVTSQRPTLEWALPTGVTMATVDLCRDRAMTMGCATLSATGTTVRPASALAPGVWFWRVRGRANATLGTRTSPVWWFRVGHGDAAVDTFHGVELDVNGDGFGDVAVGAPSASPGGRANAGAVYVYFGGPSGLSATPSQTLEGADASAELGRVVSAAGDVNGDGFGDLLVASSSFSSAAVHVYLGGASGLAAIPTRTLGPTAGEVGFGYSAAAAGDSDGDGYGDFLVGTAAFDDFAVLPPGTVSLFAGGPTGPSSIASQSWTGAAGNDYFGATVAGAGDLNGDRLADIGIGEPDARDGMSRLVGAIHVYLGRRGMPPATTAHRTVFGAYAGSELGNALLLDCDVNGDGWAEVVTSAARGDAPPAVDLPVVLEFRGSAAGVSATARAVGSLSTGTSAVLSSGDWNRDGRGDVLWGSQLHHNNTEREAGAVVLILGGASGFDNTIARRWTGTTAYQHFATAVGSTDMNGDGYLDVVVTESPFTAAQTGRLYWYAGLPVAPSPTATATAARAMLDRFGTALAY